jgi:hypothetical protein
MSAQTQAAQGYVPASSMNQLADSHYTTRFVRLPVGFDFINLFRPEAWVHVAKKLKKLDLVRVVSADDKIDVMLRIMAVSENGGVTVDYWPAAPVGEKPKVNFEPRKVNGQQCPRIEQTARGKWRVIGFTNKPIGKDLDTEDEANGAMARHMLEMGYSETVTAAE